MGFRTVVILYNDQADEWENDPDLGKKIANGMSSATLGSTFRHGSATDLHYGRVAQCVHTSVHTLVNIREYSFSVLAHGLFHDQPDTLELLKAAAGNLGYKLVKK